MVGYGEHGFTVRTGRLAFAFSRGSLQLVRGPRPDLSLDPEGRAYLDERKELEDEKYELFKKVDMLQYDFEKEFGYLRDEGENNE